jgi:predicted dehydrogenase
MITRRSFLQATLLASCLGQRPESSTAAELRAGPKRRLKIGFLGVSHSHGIEKVKVVQELSQFELIGITEADPAVRERHQKSGFPFVPQETLLKNAEVIAVESDVKDHARHGKLALSAGKHVHLEKPPADDLESFRELVALAEAKKLLLQMGYMWRYNPGINAALEAARTGWLGDVYLVRGTINTIVAPERRPEWAQFKGGTLFELGSHLIDPAVRLLGRPEKITPFLNQHARLNDRLADNTVAVFEYPRALAIITSATLQPGAGGHRFFEILGTNGTARVNPIEPPVLQVDLAKAAGPYAARSQTVPMPPFRRYVADFVELGDAILEGRKLRITPQEDLMVQETLIRACAMAGH